MTTPSKSSQALARSPILWGAVACGAFYGLLSAGVLESEFVRKYFASHPVEYVTAAMFFVGLAALAIKAIDLARQRQGLDKPLLGPIPAGGQPVVDSEPLAAQLKRLPERMRQSYLIRRLLDALEFVRRSGSAEAIDDQLKYLADRDAGEAHASYGLVRMFIWAIPILGFLGTVIGIAQAMGNLAPQALDKSLPEVMAGLNVAWSTTILALSLCIALFFAQFLVSQAEDHLLAQVDRRVEEELVGRFERMPSGPNGQLAAVRRMVETVIHSTEELVARQTQLWQVSIDAAQKRWTALADTAGQQLKTALSAALDESLKTHARELVAAQEQANRDNRDQWQQLQRALVENTEMVAGLQKAVVKKADVLGRAVETTDQVVRLQESLNANLRALAGAKNFERTVVSLAAAIHLLTARLGDLPADSPEVRLELDSDTQSGQAA